MKNHWLYIPILLFLTQFTVGQKFLNLDFEQSCKEFNTGLCHWELSWGEEGACVPSSGNMNQHLMITGKSDNSVGFVEQSLAMPPLRDIQILKLSAEINAKNIHGKGAGLNVGMYDQDGSLLATMDMGGFYSVRWIKGTSDWQEYSLTAICPTGTSKIKIGAILYGSGVARFDNYRVSLSSLENRQPSNLAIQYIDQVMDLIYRNSLVRDSIDMNELKETALKIAGPASSQSGCHTAIKYLLESLRKYGDHHSFFMTPDEVNYWENNDEPEGRIDFPGFDTIGNCGYIKVPPFHGGNEDILVAYADSLQSGIRHLSNEKIKGWVIDLRENTGGNMEPMIAGLGPLFSAEKLGSLVDINQDTESWYYKDGAYFWDDEKGISLADPARLEKNVPITVLISDQTGSSGEIVAISFIGNLKTRSFGQPSWGLTTGNGSFDLPDGARMMLASTIMADRNGKMYTGPIVPDYEIKISDKAEDLVLKSAIEWILRNPK